MKHHILAIGVSKHQNSSNNLQFADKDASDFYNLFTSNVTDLGYHKLLINSEANLAAIRTALGSELQKEVEEGDTFFFLYSGHGVEAEDSSGTALAHYLVPYDATEDFTNSCVSIDDIRDAFDKLKCTASFVFIDSCFSGAINSKSLPNPRKKALKTLKSFSEGLGKGNVVFSACKIDEEALEDSENKNGLFTFTLLQELQKQRATEAYPVAEIFDPIAAQVIKRAKERFSHSQTPTVSSHLEGQVKLPVFKNRLKVTPQLLQIPQYPQLTSANFIPPEIELSNKEQQKLINDMTNMVSVGNQSGGRIHELTFERYTWKLVKKLKRDWDEIFNTTEQLIPKVPEAVASLEGASFQLILLGAVVSTFGSKRQMEIYSEAISDILNWERGKAGLTALISVPEIILAEIIYVVGILSLANQNLENFKTLLNSLVEDNSYSGGLNPLFKYNHIYYCDALGGNATKVGDHLREVVRTFDWLPELAPRAEEKILDYQLQANFILVMLAIKNEERLFADFARFNSERIIPLFTRLKYDRRFQEQLAPLFEVKPEDLRHLLYTQLSKIEVDGIRGFFWLSAGPQQLLTAKELDELEKTRSAQATQVVT